MARSQRQRSCSAACLPPQVLNGERIRAPRGRGVADPATHKSRACPAPPYFRWGDGGGGNRGGGDGGGEGGGGNPARAVVREVAAKVAAAKVAVVRVGVAMAEVRVKKP
eukprot:2486477-Prymnesium_polylepis.1